MIAIAACGGGGDTASRNDSQFTADAVKDFFLEVTEAMRDGDETFLIENLHPITYDLYGRQPCEDYLTQLELPTLTAEIASVAQAANWSMTLDGVSVLVPDTYELAVTFTREGQSYQQLSHLGIVNGELRFFADCGEPLETPGGPSVQNT